jgi:hypothetical protein
VFRSWVDETHELVIYGLIAPDFSAEWHRVAFDGSGDEIIATSPRTVVMAQSDIAIDDSVFVVETCTPLACTRTVHDLASGESSDIVIEGERTCSFLGIAAGQLIATSSPNCDTFEAGRVTATPLDGGARRVLFDRPASGLVVESAAGLQVVLHEGGDAGTVISVVPLDGGEARELARFDAASTRVPSTVRLPVGDWVLMAGPLADTPANQSIGREVPLLLNLETGEQIELVNLPNSG